MLHLRLVLHLAFEVLYTGYATLWSDISWLLNHVTLQMGTGEGINIFMATQPCHTANGNWGLHQYLHGCSAL